MVDNIGDLNYKAYAAQKNQIRETTEKSINSLFSRNVISLDEKNNLLALYLRGEIDFGTDGLTEDEAKNFTKTTYDEILQNIQSKAESRTKTSYIVQTGDTPEKIAEKLGFEGDDAKRFAIKIKANAIKNGLYYKFGLHVGDILQLEGDFQARIDAMATDGSYKQTTDEINNKYETVRKEQRDARNAERARNSAITPDVTPKSTKATPKNAGNKDAATKTKTEVNNILQKLGNGASPKNAALNDITSQNVALLLYSYTKNTGRNLAKDLYNNGDKNLTVIKNKICFQLAKRAQELKLGGIYFGDYQKIKTPEELFNWIEKAQTKLKEAEEKKNPALKEVFESASQAKVQKQRSTKDIQRDAQVIANDLFKEIDGIGSDANVTKSILKKMTPENVAFVVNGYLNAKATVTTLRIKRNKENSSHRTLAKDLSEESGISINDIKNSICKPLATQAKNIGLRGIYYGDYQKINDIDELDTWITNAATKIREAMTVNVNTSQDSVGRNEKSADKAKSPIYKEAGIVKIAQKYDKDGNVIESTYTYKNGKVVREYQDPKRGRVRELVNPGNTPPKENTPKIYEPVPMTIKLPNDARPEEKEFAKALEKNKAKLMSMLGIDSDTYNKLARLALAIAKHETDFSHGGEYSKYKYKVGDYLDKTKLVPNIYIAGAASIAEKTHDWSYGPTQIKFELQKKDKWIADKFEELGLKKGADLYDMENSALATMVVLVQNDRIIKGNKKYQNGIEASRGSVVTIDGWEIKNGHATKTGHTKSWVNTVTEEDAHYYFWNGQAAQIIDGTMEPEANSRVQDVRIQLERYSIDEDIPAKEKALKDAQVKNKRKNVNTSYNEYKSFVSNSNNGAIGSIVFMPKMYKKDLSNKESELHILETALNRNGINAESAKALLYAVKSGEIAFEYGLTEAEASTLTQKDVDLLLKHIGKLKQTLEKSGIKFSDGISSAEALQMRNKHQDTIRLAEEGFNTEYLNAHTKIVDINSVDKSNVAMALNDNQLDVTSMHRNDGERRGFVGFRHRKLGVNPANTSNANVALARAAEKEATKRGSAGHCLDGVRATFDNIGINTRGADMEYTPKMMGEYFAKHPDRFEEVRYINIGNGNAKQITYADLPKLPAGYIVVFIPDPKFSKEPGHIAITNGNGQGYADEGDNLNWGDYSESTKQDGTNNTGKGEHGTFRVFRLTDKWKVDENGKLKFEE